MSENMFKWYQRFIVAGLVVIAVFADDLKEWRIAFLAVAGGILGCVIAILLYPPKSVQESRKSDSKPSDGCE